MIFNSASFLLFAAIVIPLYWVLPRGPRLWLVFLSSLVFYGFWRVEYLPVMLASTVTDYWCSLGIAGASTQRRRKLYLALSLAINLGLLFYFKYLMFFVDNATGLMNWLGFDIDPPRLSIVLPLGISFYTFQTISYTVDVYRGFIKPERNFILYGCYVTFFPQLVAGPILRAREVIYQFAERRRFELEDFALGLRRLIFGLFLKVVFADHIAPQVDVGFAQPLSHMGALDVWTLAFLFGFQIYFDFAAYSHIAIGCARMMGILLPENFDNPYFSTSPRDFWKRWHISLSSWIRDYLYLPLAGERVRDDRSTGGLAPAFESPGRDQRTRALFMTWAIMGLWHGASWTFVFWGLYHATFVYAQRRIAPLTRQLSPRLQTIGGWVVTLPLMMLAWISFRAANVGDALAMYAKVFDPRLYLHLGLRENTYLQAAVVMLCLILARVFTTMLLPVIDRHPATRAVVHTMGYAVAIALVFVFLRPINQFIYFQF